MGVKKSNSIMCSECFHDTGLKYEASKLGFDDDSICPVCGNRNGIKLTNEDVHLLCKRFFISGTYEKTEFGGTNVLNVSNDGFSDSNITFGEGLNKDISLLYDRLGIGVFYAAPQMWRTGLNNWLTALDSKDLKEREKVIEIVINRIPTIEIGIDSLFYRMRTNLKDGIFESKTFDAPPTLNASDGRLNIKGTSVLYGAFDIETCIHECRASINDILYIATIKPLIKLKLLDFTNVIENLNETTPFEILNTAVSYLFTANSHVYPITQALAEKVQSMGYDGVIYPSFFNQIRNNNYKNIALFGRPIEERKVSVECVNRLVLSSVEYNFILGPTFN